MPRVFVSGSKTANWVFLALSPPHFPSPGPNPQFIVNSYKLGWLNASFPKQLFWGKHCVSTDEALFKRWKVGHQPCINPWVLPIAMHWVAPTV